MTLKNVIGFHVRTCMINGLQEALMTPKHRMAMKMRNAVEQNIISRLNFNEMKKQKVMRPTMETAQKKMNVAMSG